MANAAILTVSELTNQIKIHLENEFQNVTIVGELSNYKPYSSGHWYFNLKDADAVINCAMWKSFNSGVFFKPKDGMKVVLTGRITVYPPRGNYQFDVRLMKPAGEGELQMAFEELKQKLNSEGLFNAAYKKSLPPFPQKIALITSKEGAAIRDMLNIARRRFPLMEVVVASCKVQGAGAAEDIAEKIKMVNTLKDIDLIILGRGGGSIEDLWAFNEEIVARSIFKSKIPIITGIGHEIDTTIADYVSDLRAPTPSAAMELATPNIDDLFEIVSNISYTLTDYIKKYFELLKKRVNNFMLSYGFRMPADLVHKKTQRVDFAAYKMERSIEKLLTDYKNRVKYNSRVIESGNIKNILKRGFTAVKQDGKYVERKIKFKEQSGSTIVFFDGEVKIN